MVDDVHYKDISVGTIFSCVEAKIVNVPDLNYTVQDLNSLKKSEPRG